MSRKQICFQVPRLKLVPADDQAVNSRLLVLVWRQKMHGSKSAAAHSQKLTVDNIWQTADAGDQEHNIRRGTKELSGKDNNGLLLGGENFKAKAGKTKKDLD